jgi:hypothetical protein
LERNKYGGGMHSQTGRAVSGAAKTIREELARLNGEDGELPLEEE